MLFIIERIDYCSNNTLLHAVDNGTVTPTPPGNGTFECTYEGDIISYFNSTPDGLTSQYEGEFEICIGGFYGSVCDIGWDEAAAQALCRDRFGYNYGM